MDNVILMNDFHSAENLLEYVDRLFKIEDPVGQFALERIKIAKLAIFEK